MTKKQWMTTKETAKALSVSTKTLYRLIKKGQLIEGTHYVNICFTEGRATYRFNLEAIEHWLQP